MKKSFMTRVLATGLSLAMAFSLTAATNVSVASAAAKPAMKSSKMTVKVGQSKNYQAKKETQKAFKITKVKMSAAGQTKAKVTVNSSKKSIKVEGLAPTKSSNVVIYFKNNKTKKTTKVTTKVVVKAVKEEKAIKSATQTGVKTITVETNFDATNSTVKVTRGNNAVATDKVTFSEDGKTITINTTANIVAGEYTVSVDDLTATVKGETSKVAEIKFLSEQAAAIKDEVVGSPTNGKYTKATVGYVVYDQFGSDITKTTTLTVNSSANAPQLKAKDHMIEFTSTDTTNGYMINRDLITVVLLDTQTGVSASATLTVSMEAYAKEITFEKLYNAEGKTLTEDTDTANDYFYALFTAKDQYGNKFKSYKNIYEGKDLFLTVMGGLTALDKYAEKQPFTVMTVEGEDYLAYRLVLKTNSITPTAGEATIQVLSTGGTSCTGTVTVAEGDRVVSISVSNPGVLAAGEKTEIPFTATDAAGKEVTSFKILNRVEISDNSTAELKFVKNVDGTAKLVLNAEGMTYSASPAANVSKNQSSMQTYTFTTVGKKFYHASLTITENARPVAIDGVSSSTELSGSANYYEVKVKDLKIEDQYGRVMDEAALDRVLAASGKKNYVSTNKASYAYKLLITGVSSSDSTVVRVDQMDLSNITKADTVIAKLYVGNKGTATVTFGIKNAYGPSDTDYMVDSADVLYTVKDTNNLQTATATVSDLYVGATAAISQKYAQDVVVKAGNAQLNVTDYTVQVPDGLTAVKKTDAKLGDIWQIYSTQKKTDITEFAQNKADTITKTIKITLNGTGETITKDVVLSQVDPYVNSVSLYGDTYTVAQSAKPGILNKKDVYAYCVKELKDQYGKTIDLALDGDYYYKTDVKCEPAVNFNNIVDDGLLTAQSKPSNNGKSNASLSMSSLFKAATMSIAYGSYKDGQKTADINLVVAKTATDAGNSINEELVTAMGAAKPASDLVSVISKNVDMQSQSWRDLKSDVDKQNVARVVKATYPSTTGITVASVQAVVSASAVTAAGLRVSVTSGDAYVTSGGVANGTDLVISAAAIKNAANVGGTYVQKVSIASVSTKAGCTVVAGASDGNTAAVKLDTTKLAAAVNYDVLGVFTVTYEMASAYTGSKQNCFKEQVTYRVYKADGKFVIEQIKDEIV